ncbi:MAG: inositol monophosphatase family protein, partial [Propionibacteriaceae bacterium]
IEQKSDGTPVTSADREVEAAVRATLAKARPRDSIHGEEEPDKVGGSRRWIIDPIDGTANYLRGIPVWATLIALEEAGEIVLGVVSAPALGRRWWASRENGAFTGKNFRQGVEMQVSNSAHLSDAMLSFSSVQQWVDAGRGQEFVDLMREAGRTRAFGDFWSYMLVAEGALDIACEPELALHDMAACSIIVTEAGGSFTDLDGIEGPYGDGAVATNGLLHDQVLRQLNGEA